MSPVDSAIGTGRTSENQSVIGDDELDPMPEDTPPNATIIPNHGQQQHPMMSQGNPHLGHNPSSFSGMQNYTDQHRLG